MPFALALLAATMPVAALPDASLRTGPAVPDRELATMRGGIRLPNGLTVAIGIDIQTRINGVLALHTIYSSEATASGIRVFTDGTTSPSIAAGTTVVTTGGASGISIDVARSPTGTVVMPSGGAQPAVVNVVSGPTATWLDAVDQTNVPVVANGPAVAASSGTIALVNDDRGARVTLVAPGIEVRHLVGQATGAVIANTADNRAIDTVSSINVNLVGVPQGLVSGTLMVNRLATEAASRR